MSEESDPRKISWQSTKLELNLCRLPTGPIDYDKYRKDALAALQRHTGVPVVVYATDFMSADKVRMSEGQIAIDMSDIQGFIEVLRDLPDGPLDVILHTPGGSPEVAESIVKMLRARFAPVRFIVPVMAKSAGTMIALSGNQILIPMGAELGPIDPQFRMPDGAGGFTFAPAQAIIDQFKQAQAEIIGNQAITPSWIPFLQMVGPGLLHQCLNAIKLSKALVEEWVRDYMLAADPNGPAAATRIVDYLVDHNQFYSHGRRVSIQELKGRGAKIDDIFAFDPALSAHVERAWYAVQHTFEGTGVFKLFENSKGQTFARIVQVKIFPMPPAGPSKAQTSRSPIQADW